MRARHRHFQFKSAGAVLSLDARYVHGISDAANLETWSDRSGNANNGTRTGGSIPTYRASEINGTPAIRFDNQYYDLTLTIPLSSTTITALRRATAGTRSTPLGGVAISEYSFFWFSDNGVYSRHNVAVGLTNATNQTQTGNFVWGGIWDVRSSTVYRNGSVVGSTQTSNADAGGSFTFLGRWNNANANPVSWGAYHVLNSAASASLHKRLQHHVAYSFKISCN
jgi:hypothetical protein